MTLYKRPETAFWYYEFMVGGKRHRGSTKTADKLLATAYEAAQRLAATEASQRLIDDSMAAVQARSLWGVAQSWLAMSEKTLADHQGNLSRVRKLFGREMRLNGGKWEETDSGRYGFPKSLTVREVTPRLLENLRSARKQQGNSAGTIEREMALMHSLLAHVGVRSPYKPFKSAQVRVNKVLALPAQPEEIEAVGCGFSTAQYEAVDALRVRLEKSLQTTVTLRISVGEPYRIAGADEAGAGVSSEPGDFMRDQRLRLTLWADAPRPAEGTRWPLLSFPADAPDLTALLDAARAEAAFVWEALIGTSASDKQRGPVQYIAVPPVSPVVLMMQARAARKALALRVT